MAVHNMAAEPLLRSHSPLQIYRIAGTQLPQIGLTVGFRHNICSKGPAVEGHNRQTNTIDGNAVAYGHVLQHLGGFHRQHHSLSLPVYPAHSSHFFYNSCKHGAPSSLKANSLRRAHSGDNQ
ncbi:hypothetical protein D3C76_1594260 [compost metagenome]